MRRYRGGGLEVLFGCALLLAAACGGSKGGSCPQGTESCPCYGNSTCNTGLDCRSNVCVNLGGAGGGQGGSAGSGGKGGTGTGGDGGGGGSVVADASLDVSDGSTCTNTASDPKNCGSCGHVCKNADPLFGGDCPTGGCCVNGACGPTPSACITQQDGFTTCTAYCASIGETCVQQGCVLGSVTWEGWITAMRCESTFNPTQARGTGTCDTPIAFDGTAVDVRCCCTDTH